MSPMIRVLKELLNADWEYILCEVLIFLGEKGTITNFDRRLVEKQVFYVVVSSQKITGRHLFLSLYLEFQNLNYAFSGMNK